MPRRSAATLAVLVLLAGVLAAGCGDDDGAEPEPSGAQPPPARFGASASDDLLLSGGGIWWEGNATDPNKGCQLYSYRVGPSGERHGVRVQYFPSIVTGGCRITEPASPQGTFTWVSQGNQVWNQFASGYTEQFTIDQGDAGLRTITLTRAGGLRAVWVGCGHPAFPPVLASGCV